MNNINVNPREPHWQLCRFDLIRRRGKTRHTGRTEAATAVKAVIKQHRTSYFTYLLFLLFVRYGFVFAASANYSTVVSLCSLSKCALRSFYQKIFPDRFFYFRPKKTGWTNCLPWLDWINKLALKVLFVRKVEFWVWFPNHQKLTHWDGGRPKVSVLDES